MPSRPAWLCDWIAWFDYGVALPLISRLEPQTAKWFVRLRGTVNFVFDLEWRTLSLRRSYVRGATLQAMRAISQLTDSKRSPLALTLHRYICASWEEYDAQRLSRIDYSTIAWHSSGMDSILSTVHAGRGVVLLTGHFDSLYVGLMLLAKHGATVNLMSSSIIDDARVPAKIQKHFARKIDAMAARFSPGKVMHVEDGIRSFITALRRGEVVVIACDGPATATGRKSVVRFLGGDYLMTGGPEFLAKKSSALVSMFVCNRERDGQFRIDFSPPKSLEDGGLQQAYDYLDTRIRAEPWRWWAADQWVNLLPAPELVTPIEPTMSDYVETDHPQTVPPSCEVLLFVDSPLQDTQELTFGIDALKAQWAAASPSETLRIHEVTSLAAPSPTDILVACTAEQLLVVLDAAVVAVDDLRAQLNASLVRSGATCVVSAGRVDATGEWTIDYCTRSELERYVHRRKALPEHEEYRSSAPKVYLLQTRAARDFATRHPDCGWADLPHALGAACRLAPRAFVHSYGDYQMSDRREMLDMLPDTVHRLLDVGGGEGGFVRAFAQRPGVEACLVEPGAIAAQRARDHGVTVFERRVEALEPAEVGLFDAVSFLDVLEHLETPIEALRRVRSVLRPGGHVLVSVPNIGFWPIVRDLLMGRFDYLPVGILCNTHLRFFTERSLLAMLHEAGFTVEKVRRQGQPIPTSMRARLEALNGPDCPIDLQSLETDSLHVLATLR